MRSASRGAALVVAAALGTSPLWAARPEPPTSSVGAVRVVEGHVEHGRGGSWKDESASFRIAPGERVRTGRDGLAVLSLPWMQILVGRDTVVSLPSGRVLSTSLERGRIEQRASSDILKVKTAEAEVRGAGSVVVSRADTDPGLTRVSPIDGTFLVKAGRKVVAVSPGQGLLVRGKGATPEVVALPATPRGLVPGRDPVYVERGQSITLAWTGTARRYHVEVSSLSGDEVLLARDVAGVSVPVSLTGLGTFRWRVSAVDEDGLEGAPSAPGFVCVVEK
jgi:hypothetical protein